MAGFAYFLNGDGKIGDRIAAHGIADLLPDGGFAHTPCKSGPDTSSGVLCSVDESAYA